MLLTSILITTVKLIPINQHRLAALVITLYLPFSLQASDNVDIPLYEKGTDVFYLTAHLDGFGEAEFMLDTGSGPIALAAEVLSALTSQGKAQWSHRVQVVLANGDYHSINIYQVDALELSEQCRIENVEAAELPQGTRNIIGINLLKKTAPFSISTTPSLLSLGGCQLPAKTLSTL